VGKPAPSKIAHRGSLSARGPLCLRDSFACWPACLPPCPLAPPTRAMPCSSRALRTHPGSGVGASFVAVRRGGGRQDREEAVRTNMTFRLGRLNVYSPWRPSFPACPLLLIRPVQARLPFASCFCRPTSRSSSNCASLASAMRSSPRIGSRPSPPCEYTVRHSFRPSPAVSTVPLPFAPSPLSPSLLLHERLCCLQCRSVALELGRALTPMVACPDGNRKC